MSTINGLDKCPRCSKEDAMEYYYDNKSFESMEACNNCGHFHEVIVIEREKFYEEHMNQTLLSRLFKTKFEHHIVYHSEELLHSENKRYVPVEKQKARDMFKEYMLSKGITIG